MSAAQPNASSNAVSLAIWIAVGTVALVIGIIMLTRLAVSSYGSRSLDPAAMTPEARPISAILPVDRSRP